MTKHCSTTSLNVCIGKVISCRYGLLLILLKLSHTNCCGSEADNQSERQTDGTLIIFLYTLDCVPESNHKRI